MRSEKPNCTKPLWPLRNLRMSGICEKRPEQLPKLDVAGSTPVARSNVSQVSTSILAGAWRRDWITPSL